MGSEWTYPDGHGVGRDDTEYRASGVRNPAQKWKLLQGNKTELSLFCGDSREREPRRMYDYTVGADTAWLAPCCGLQRARGVY